MNILLELKYYYVNRIFDYVKHHPLDKSPLDIEMIITTTLSPE